MDANADWFLMFMFFWLLVLTVAFVLHWIKVERNVNFENRYGTKVPEGLKSKILGEP